MGLDTTHDCWHGPYSSFMRWRTYLHHVITGDPNERKYLEAAWESGKYDDQEVAINILMNHSDCDGIIPTLFCGYLADELEKLAEKMPDIDEWDMKETTLQFAAGCRAAFEACEDVEFH